MKALRPVASRLGLRSSTARRSKPLGKRNATAQAVEGKLGGFCVCVWPRDPKLSREALDLLAFSRVADLRDNADEMAAMYRSLAPTPKLDVELPQLDADPRARERQLLLLWQVEREFRLRLQNNARRLLEMLADAV